MLGYEKWIKWAPTKNQLAFISGEGRFFVLNYSTKVTEIPTLNKQKDYTRRSMYKKIERSILILKRNY